MMADVLREHNLLKISICTFEWKAVGGVDIQRKVSSESCSDA